MVEYVHDKGFLAQNSPKHFGCAATIMPLELFSEDFFRYEISEKCLVFEKSQRITVQISEQFLEISL